MSNLGKCLELELTNFLSLVFSINKTLIQSQKLYNNNRFEESGMLDTAIWNWILDYEKTHGIKLNNLREMVNTAIGDNTYFFDPNYTGIEKR